MRRKLLTLLALWFPTFQVSFADAGFSQEKALVLLKTLTQEIGPRTMGSPAEGRALDFALQKFKEYGCSNSYVLPFTTAGDVNTSSGIAVGVHKGTSGRTIVIGAHIDTNAPEVPGTNDDGSGVACVLELARVLNQRGTRSTVLFCCWGGEERGLWGSKYFVEHYPLIDSVAFMVQIDMADGAGQLEVDPSGIGASAPTWLVKAAYDVFYNELAYTGLVYPLSSTAQFAALGGGANSDHASFLQKGIPAICFSSDLKYPIHSPQDNWDNFTPSGLKRSGVLVLKLVERLDGGVQPPATEQYVLFQIGATPLFLPRWLLWVWVGISVAVAIGAFAGARKRRERAEPATTARWSGLKILLFTVIIQACVWYSENIIGLIRGERFPWVNNFSWYVMLGTLCGLVGVWIAFQLAARLRLASDQFPFARAAFALFLVSVILGSLSGPELAAYPAAALLLFSLAIIVRAPMAKLLLMLASLYPIFRLVFPESLGLTQRALARGVFAGFPENLLYNLAFVVIFTLISLPYTLGFAAVYRDAKGGLLWLRKFGGRPVLIGLCLPIVALIIFLSLRVTYNRTWYKSVRVEQRYSAGSDSSVIFIEGSEYLKGLRCVADGKDTVFDDRSAAKRFHPAGNSSVSWCAAEHQTFSADSVGRPHSLFHVKHVLQIHSLLRPLTVRVTYRSTLPFEISSTWIYRGTGQSDTKTFSWYSYPSGLLEIPVTFRLKPEQVVTETAEVTYDSLAYPLALSRPYTNVVMRTIVTGRDTVRLGARSGVAVLHRDF